MIDMPRQEQANMLPNLSVLTLFISRTFFEKFIANWRFVHFGPDFPTCPAHFFPFSWVQDFPQTYVFVATKSTYQWTRFLSKQKLFLGHLGPVLSKFGKTFFFINQALSLLSLYGPLTSCKRSEKTNEPVLRNVCL